MERITIKKNRRLMLEMQRDNFNEGIGNFEVSDCIEYCIQSMLGIIHFSV
jgi:hypothetical protein